MGKDLERAFVSSCFEYDIKSDGGESSKGRFATAGIASFAALVIVVAILAVFVTMLYRSNSSLKRRLQTLSETVFESKNNQCCSGANNATGGCTACSCDGDGEAFRPNGGIGLMSQPSSTV